MAARAERRDAVHGERVRGRRAVFLQVSEMQRARLIAAAVAILDERGYAQTTVAQITGRSRMSRRTFYELFTNLESCLVAAVEDALEVVERELRAGELELVSFPWAERIRIGLWRVLDLFDREPVLARMLVVHSQRGGPAVAAARERALARLTALVDEGRHESTRGGELSRLTAEGLVGATVAIVQARLASRRRPALTGLLGELTAMVMLPYFGIEAARRERTRPLPPRPRPARAKTPLVAEPDRLLELPMRLTYRTARVLDVVGEHPRASNRQVAVHAGISDAGQTSKLLRRLERLGLLANVEAGRAQGEPNAWALTPRGEAFVQSIPRHVVDKGRRAA